MTESEHDGAARGAVRGAGSDASAGAAAERSAPATAGGAQSTGRPPTIHDVAREAGVSKSLVSLVFNGGENVSEERQERVLRAAERLGYRPNLVAQSLKSGRPDFVAILVSNLHNPLFGEIVGAAKARLGEAGRRTLIVSAQVDDGSGESVLDEDNLALLRDLRPSGVITVGTIPRFTELTALVQEIPLVVASAIDVTGAAAATVRTDDRVGIGMVVDHLVAGGAERIAFVGGTGGPVATGREAAFREAMAAHGREGEVRLEPAAFTSEGARRAVERLLAAGAAPDAIVAVNDLTAIGVISALEDAGIAVPAECRVTGYDNTSLSEISRISLTTIDPDNRRIGREAAEAMLAAADGPTAGRPSAQAEASGAQGGAETPGGAEAVPTGPAVLIPPRLVVRGSSASG